MSVTMIIISCGLFFASGLCFTPMLADRIVLRRLRGTIPKSGLTASLRYSVMTAEREAVAFTETLTSHDAMRLANVLREVEKEARELAVTLETHAEVDRLETEEVT